MTDDELRVDVTNDDIRAATAAWVDALRRGDPIERVLMLCDDLDRLDLARERQIADEPRRH
jgi:ketosteroid isomerase-like protein